MLTAASPAVAAPANKEAGGLEAAFERFVAAAVAEDCKTVLKTGEPMLRRHDKQMTSEGQAYVLGVLAACAGTDGNAAKARDYARRATSIDGSEDWVWRLRFALDLEAKDHEAAVKTVELMSQGRGAALNSVPIQWLFQFDKALKDASKTALRKRLLSIVGSGAYVPGDVGGDAQGLGYSYAELLADEGEAEAAKAVLANLYAQELLIDATFDPRLRPLLPPGQDLRAVTETALAKDRELMARHPDLMMPMLEVVRDLHRLGRADEALTLLLAAATQVEDEKGFTDREERLPWYWDALARTYVHLNRYPDAVAAFRKGGALAEGGGVNVSQILNLAVVQVRFGEPAEALKTLAVFDSAERPLSGYGQMVLRVARGCAHAALGNAAAAEADLTYALAHEKEGRGIVTSLYLCLGRLDEAAASLIRRLDDPKERSDALQDVAEYAPRAVAIPLSKAEEGMIALKAREDVKAAIGRAGGVPRIPLQSTEI